MARKNAYPFTKRREKAEIEGGEGHPPHNLRGGGGEVSKSSLYGGGNRPNTYGFGVVLSFYVERERLRGSVKKKACQVRCATTTCEKKRQ